MTIDKSSFDSDQNEKAADNGKPTIFRFGGRILRKYRFAIGFYLFLFLVPFLYEYLAEIPPEEQLQKTQGTFLYKYSGKSGYIVQLTTSAGKMNFTCRGGFFGNQDCLTDHIHGEKQGGKQAIVWWFEQTAYPFITQRRLVRLVIDGEDEVSVSRTISITERTAHEAPYWALGTLFFFVLIVIAIESIQPKKDRRK